MTVTRTHVTLRVPAPTQHTSPQRSGTERREKSNTTRFINILEFDFVLHAAER